MEIDLDLKVKLYNEYLNNGGIEKIWFPELCESLLKVKSLPNGKVNPDTIDSCANAAMLDYIGSQLIVPFASETQLSYYETLLQKSIFYEQINIETAKEFDEVFYKYADSQNILFRGLNEAKYRLYSSLQREWINSKLYEKHTSYKFFLERLVNNVRIQQGNALTKYLDKIGIDPENDLAVLSFLQHYGCPTPLLDWTYNFSNALFFAIQNLNTQPPNWEIEKYFCVYYLEEEFFEDYSMQKLFKIGLKKQKEDFAIDFKAALKKRGFPEELIEKAYSEEELSELFFRVHGKNLMTYMTKVEKLLKAPMAYYSDDKTHINLRYSLNNNMNIVNQQGVFTWNASPTKPIEQIPFERAEQLGRDKVLFSKCININKELSSHVEMRIAKRGVTKEFIYPNARSIVRKAFEDTV